MITVDLYKRGDWRKIENVSEPFMPLHAEFDDVAAKGIAVSAVRNGKYVACGGVTFIDDEGFAWLKITKDVEKPIETAKVIKDTFELMVETVNDRISTYVLDGFKKGERLARFIGMKKNCKSLKFRDHIYNKYMVVV